MTLAQFASHQQPIYHGIVLGHSQSDPFYGMGQPHRMWPEELAKFVNLRGGRLALGNYSVGGDTSADALARLHGAGRYGTPVIAGVYLDVNDPKMATVARTQAGNGTLHEIQTITQGGNTPAAIVGGTFKVTFGANQTSALAYNITAAAMQTALNALASVTSAGGVTVALSGQVYTITFTGTAAQSLFVTDTSGMTSVFVQAIVQALKHNAYGYWDTTGPTRGRSMIGPAAIDIPSDLPAKGQVGQRQVILNDNASSSGSAPIAWQTTAGIVSPNVGTAGGGAVSVWECRGQLAGLAGWGRVAVAGQAPLGGCPRIFVMGTNYYNWSTAGGDTPATPQAQNATLRTILAAVVAAENVAISGVPTVIRTDLYGYQRARIVSGIDPNFSADTSIVPTTAYSQALSDHFFVGGVDNIHMNNQGQYVAANAVIDGGPGGTPFPTEWLSYVGAS